MAQVTSINFHQTFRPEKQYITAILEIADDPTYKSVKDISSQTGIPNGKSSGKVEPHINYAAYMGLISYDKKDSEYSLLRTALGEVVYAEDPGLQESLTILLCHCMMQRNYAGAPLWSVVFKTILPRYKRGISKDMLIKELNAIFDGKVTVKNIAPFYGSYDSFFDVIGVITDESDTISLSCVQYNREYLYLYAFVLLEYWKEAYPDQDEITSDQLKEFHFGDVFGWDMQEEYVILEHLADKGILRLNRQLMPYTVLKMAESGDLVDKLYSELC